MSAVLRRTFEGVSIVTDEDPERWSELHAAGNRIEALAPWLASFSRLRVLDLRHNMIESCAGVAACVQLITIDVRDNRLRRARKAEQGEDLTWPSPHRGFR